MKIFVEAKCGHLVTVPIMNKNEFVVNMMLHAGDVWKDCLCPKCVGTNRILHALFGGR